MIFPPTYAIANSGQLERMDPALEYDGDPRGITWIFEPPNRTSTYMMGVDPTLGRTGWSRYSRVKEDRRTNNGAIEIVRVGKDIILPDGTPSRTPDIQVCEYAAPIDAFELGFVANILGRLYAGTEEDQCEAILEVYPGPGGMTMRQMVDLGYTNLWRWQYYADLMMGESKVGWQATTKSVRDLWAKSARHLILRRVKIHSPFLVEEYADARMNDVKGYAESPNNDKGHGDRMRAFNLALWAGNKWDMDIERTKEDVTQAQQKVMDPQRSDMSMSQIMDQWNRQLDKMYGD